jgi:hypothetical protein
MNYIESTHLFLRETYNCTSTISFFLLLHGSGRMAHGEWFMVPGAWFTPVRLNKAPVMAPPIVI